jgi:hypothetical protein
MLTEMPEQREIDADSTLDIIFLQPAVPGFSTTTAAVNPLK